jgi:hypothetical protein
MILMFEPSAASAILNTYSSALDNWLLDESQDLPQAAADLICSLLWSPFEWDPCEQFVDRIVDFSVSHFEWMSERLECKLCEAFQEVIVHFPDFCGFLLKNSFPDLLTELLGNASNEYLMMAACL